MIGMILMFIAILLSWIIVPTIGLYWIITGNDPVKIVLDYIVDQLKIIKDRI